MNHKRTIKKCLTKNIELVKNVVLWIYCLLMVSATIERTNANVDNADTRNLSEKDKVESLVKKWAPLVWLAPSEKFLPGDVGEFLQHVHAEKTKSKNKYDGQEVDSYYYYDAENDELAALMQKTKQWERRDKRNFKERNFLIDNVLDLPVGEYSENWFLVTNTDIGKLLQNESTFLYGVNPSVRNVPIYAVVNMCGSSYSQQQNEDINSNIIPQYDQFEFKKNPYIPLLIKQPSVDRNNANINQNTEDMLNEIDAESTKSIRLIKRSTELFENEPSLVEMQTEESSKMPIISLTKEETDWKPSMSTADRNEIKQTADNGNFQFNTKQSEQANLGNGPIFHVTYWMFYPYSQGKQMCTLSLGLLGKLPIPLIFGMCIGTRTDFGSHVGDWEHMTLYFNGREEPDEMYVSAHDAGAYYGYDRLTGTFEFRSQETRKGILQRPIFPRTVLTSSNHPVLFAAQGSHGLWTAPGKHRFVRVPRLYDVNGFGTPWSTWKSVDIVYDFETTERGAMPSWLQFRGRWGNPKSKCHPLRRIGLHFCEYSDGPTGIPMKAPHFFCNNQNDVNGNTKK